MPNYLVYKAGVASVGQYQMSAIPYATSSVEVPIGTPVEIPFPRITKFITIRNVIPTASTDQSFRVGFSSLGTAGAIPAQRNFLVLANGESYTAEWRLASVFLMAESATAASSASIIAGLTAISTASLGFDNWSGSLGIG